MKTRVSVILDHVGMSLRTVFDRAEIAAKSGADGLWLSQAPNGRDTNLLLAALAAGTSEVTIGTAVLPIYMSPPAVMAETALTLDEISGNRLVLGLGRGHRIFGQWMLGGTYHPSVGAMREYLTVVTSLIREGDVSMTGSWFEARVVYGEPRRPQLPVYLGAFGPRMLELAGELADGVILWMCTPSYISDVVVPRLRAGWARRRGDHDGFGVVVMLPADASPHPDSDRGCGRSMLGEYIRLKNYEKLLVANGFGAEVQSGWVSDAMIDKLCAVGSGQLIRERIAAYREAGVTEVAVVPLDNKYFAATVEGAVGASGPQ